MAGRSLTLIDKGPPFDRLNQGLIMICYVTETAMLTDEKWSRFRAGIEAEFHRRNLRSTPAGGDSRVGEFEHGASEYFIPFNS